MGPSPEHRARPRSRTGNRKHPGPLPARPPSLPHRGPVLTCSLGCVTPPNSCAGPSPCQPSALHGLPDLRLSEPWCPGPPPPRGREGGQRPRCPPSGKGNHNAWRFACPFGRETRPPGSQSLQIRAQRVPGGAPVSAAPPPARGQHPWEVEARSRGWRLVEVATTLGTH